jgi:hypothetical protein
MQPTVRRELGSRRFLQTAGRRSRRPWAVARSVCQLVGVASLVGVFFCAVATIKLDNDPTNDMDGKCILVVSTAALAGFLLHHLYHDHSHIPFPPRSTPRASGLVPALDPSRSLRPQRRSRCAAFERTVCTSL